MLYFTIVKQYGCMKKWNNQKTKDLLKAILALKKEKEARAFLRDLMTKKEIIELGNRWKAAQMLAEEMTYPKIQKETGLSTRTIARISDWLKNGKGGYKLAINKIHRHNSSQKRLIMTG
jgi:TrpR-related protein YerC/YecD